MKSIPIFNKKHRSAVSQRILTFKIVEDVEFQTETLSESVLSENSHHDRDVVW